MKIAVVTGASSGMGREFVLQLKEYVGVDEIWAVARRADALEKLKTESSVPVRPVSLDLLEESSGVAVDETRLRRGHQNLMVTPRDIDAQVRDLGKVIGYGINWALQDLEIEEINALLS